MAKRIRGTTPSSGTVTVNFNGIDYSVSIIKATDGTYDSALPVALDNALANGGNVAVSYASQTISLTVPGSGTTSNWLGSVGQAPPTYTGNAALPSIPIAPEAATALTFTSYGNGFGEFLWASPALIDTAAGDTYQLVVDGIIRYLGIANSFTRSGMSNGAHTASVRLVRANGDFGPAASLAFTI